jgi:hypothetical protein
VIEPIILDDVSERAAHPGFGVGRAVDEAWYSGQDDGPRAHRARLQRHVESVVGETPVAGDSGRAPKSQHLGVRGRIGQLSRAVVRFRDTARRSDHHGADGYLVFLGRAPCLPQRAIHPEAVTLLLARLGGQVRGVGVVASVRSGRRPARDEVEVRKADGARLRVVSLDEALLGEPVHVVGHGAGRPDVQGRGDIAEAGLVVVRQKKVDDEVVHPPCVRVRHHVRRGARSHPPGAHAHGRAAPGCAPGP